MLPYIALIVLPVIFQHISLSKGTITLSADKKKSETAMKVFWFILLVLLVLRSEDTGRDLDNYKRIYETIAKSGWEQAIKRSAEVGYNFVNKLISFWDGSFRWLMILSAIASVYFTAKAYIKYSEDAVLTIATYLNFSCFLLLFSGLKQSIAMSLGFVAFELVRKKKIVPFLIIVVIATMFHASAFMLLFMYPLYHIRVRKGHLVFVIPALLIVFGFNQPIFTFLGNILESFTEYDTTITETGAYATLILFVILAVFSFVIPDEKKLDQDTIGLRSFLLFSVALQMFASLHPLAMRMNYYYIVFTPILVSRIVKCPSTYWLRVAKFARNVMVVYFILYFFITAPRDNVMDTFPYQFFWQTN